MASNDSSAAVAAAAAPVNAVSPILPQTENKAPEAAQANHDSVATAQPAAAAVSVSNAPTPSPASVKETQQSNNPPAAASSNPLPPSIPSSNTPENNTPSKPNEEDVSSQQPEPKPSEDSTANANTNVVNTTTNDKSNAQSESETKPEDKKEENETEAVTEPAKADIIKPDQPTAVLEEKSKTNSKESNNSTPSPNTTNTTTTSNTSSTSAEPSVAGSEKSNKPQNGPSESPQPEVPAAKAAAAPQPKPVATIKPMVESAKVSDSEVSMDTSTPISKSNNPKSINKRPSAAAEDGNEKSDKRIKASSTPSGSKEGNKTAEQVLEYMDKTFDHRRKIITKQMPTIPELKSMYPELFMGKQLLLEFQRITKIDIDQKIQEFCVRYATAVIEMARSNKAAAPVLARWEKAKQENETLKQYWDMVTALCLLPLHFGENFVEMVLEIEEDEEVKAQGKIVPTLVARGNIFRTDEFFLIAENTIVQEFEEFTIAFASLYSSYWVFNMVYPETIENTYNYIQRCIVRQREPGAISTVCKNFTKSLQKWNKDKEGK